ncbi:uncharacterized protein CIMG_11310 [Coccidioides immitis RS]|uniref:Uncharacterized protein n=1 Tax=Coccidioides immitis (strain RS) TaxID=246410 RepID=A0A0D8JUK0_COCIM|nr:uncharacterized protein CIMG_11310 [Coccidioides immitis RS]KJF60972.1 hypothetical protein CIMG_11310 [Coccidioides immitis RS]
MRPPDNLAPGIVIGRCRPPPHRGLFPRQAAVLTAGRREASGRQRRGGEHTASDLQWASATTSGRQNHVARSGDNPNLARRNSWPHAAKPPGRTTGAKPSMRGPTFALLPIRPIVSYHVKMRQLNLFGINLGTFAADL